MIRSLIWKEWREQRWKVFYISILMAAANVIGLKTRLMPDELIIYISVFIGVFLLPIIIGMGLFATEHEERSLPTLLALPVRNRIIFIVKMGIGTLACLIPFGVSLASAWMMAGGREGQWSRVFLLYGCGLGFSLTLLVWMVAFGIHQPSEARAGLIGLAVIAGWMVLLGLEEIYRNLQLRTYMISPFYWFKMMDRSEENILYIAIIQSLLTALMLVWAGRRFANTGRKQS